MPIPADEPAPDFRHVRSWVFDLDHTLYTVDAARHAAMSERICAYVQRHLGLARDPAWALQKRYLKDYGSTLSGLVRHHGVDPDHYHDSVNDLDALGLAADPALAAALERLPGRRLIFTNNCGRYAKAVLERLGVADRFDDIVDAKAMRHVPKPNASAYDCVVALGAAPGASAMFDDSQRNLEPAHRLGMTTVWHTDSPAGWDWDKALPLPAHIHYQTHRLSEFLHSIRI